MSFEEDEMTTAIGKLLKTARKKLKISQTDVAKKLEFSTVFISRIELGQALLPAKYVNPVSKILEIDRDDILSALKKDLGDNLERKARKVTASR